MEFLGDKMLPIIIFSSIVLVIIVVFILYFAKFSSTKIIENGKRLLNQNNISEALSLFKKLVNKKPDDPNIHFFLAESYYRSEDNDMALTEFKKVETFGRSEYKYFNEKMLYERITDLHLIFGQAIEAQKALLSILELYPRDYKTHLKIGDIFFKRKMFDNALSYYQKAMIISEKNAIVLFKCGEAFYYKNDFTQALGYLKGAIKYDPTILKTHYYIGMIYKMAKNYAKAINEFTKASQNKEVRINALYQQGITYHILNENIQAIKSIEKALKSAKDEFNIADKSSLIMAIRYELASCYEQEKKILLALDQWENINAVNNNYEDVKEKLELYSDLRLDDELKDFLTSSNKMFEETCKKILSHNKQELLELSLKNGSFIETIVSENEGEWRNIRKIKKIIQFHRDNEAINDKLLRTSLEKMKKIGASEIIIYSTSGFTKSTINLASTRPTKLFGREELSSVLKII